MPRGERMSWHPDYHHRAPCGCPWSILEGWTKRATQRQTVKQSSKATSGSQLIRLFFFFAHCLKISRWVFLSWYGNQRNALIHTIHNLVFLKGERKLEDPEETHVDMDKTWTLRFCWIIHKFGSAFLFSGLHHRYSGEKVWSGKGHSSKTLLGCYLFFIK